MPVVTLYLNDEVSAILNVLELAGDIENKSALFARAVMEHEVAKAVEALDLKIRYYHEQVQKCERAKTALVAGQYTTESARKRIRKVVFERLRKRRPSTMMTTDDDIALFVASMSGWTSSKQNAREFRLAYSGQTIPCVLEELYHEYATTKTSEVMTR